MARIINIKMPHFFTMGNYIFYYRIHKDAGL
jgi:hypothetical protein